VVVVVVDTCGRRSPDRNRGYGPYYIRCYIRCSCVQWKSFRYHIRYIVVVVVVVVVDWSVYVPLVGYRCGIPDDIPRCCVGGSRLRKGIPNTVVVVVVVVGRAVVITGVVARGCRGCRGCPSSQTSDALRWFHW
jgi:hypothetical protein